MVAKRSLELGVGSWSLEFGVGNLESEKNYDNEINNVENYQINLRSVFFPYL
jgi:hypothetical protein